MNRFDCNDGAPGHHGSQYDGSGYGDCDDQYSNADSYGHDDRYNHNDRYDRADRHSRDRRYNRDGRYNHDGRRDHYDRDNQTLENLLREAITGRRSNHHVKLPTFSGRNGDENEVSCEEFLYCAQKLWDRRHDKRLSEDDYDEIVLHALKGDARSSYIAYAKEGLYIPDRMKRIAHVYGDKKTREERVQQFCNAKQNDRENVEDYAIRFEKLWAKAREAEPMSGMCNRPRSIKQIFLNGLHSRMANTLYFMVPDDRYTFGELRNKAIEILSYQSSKPSKAVSGSQNHSDRKPVDRKDIVCYHCKNKGHVRSRCWRYLKDKEEGNLKETSTETEQEN